MLQNDPAYDSATFPTLDDIKAHEGVDWYEGGSFLGPGPDSDASSDFSEHYYNPRTGEGMSPSSVRQDCQALTNALFSGDLEGARIPVR